jgi:hypothetical protein
MRAFQNDEEKKKKWDAWIVDKDRKQLEDWLACDASFSKEVARTINFPDDLDTIMLMVEALPNRGWFQTLLGDAINRDTLMNRLKTSETPRKINSAITACTETRSEQQREERWQELLEHLRNQLETQPELAVEICKASDWPLPFSLVLHEELKEIDSRRNRRGTHPAIPAFARTHSHSGASSAYCKAADRNLVGLAFSGGGIRSATFNLGVLQGLAALEFEDKREARRSVLGLFDYISTVSGGGYIGCWLAGWAKKSSFSEVRRSLSPTLSPKPDAENVRPIGFLRRYSNYLTPELGLFSADTWTMAAVYLRNVTLNVAILVAGIAAILLIPRVIARDIVRPPVDSAARSSGLSILGVLPSPLVEWLGSESFLLWTAVALLIFSSLYIALNLSVTTKPYRDPYSFKKKFKWIARYIGAREPNPTTSEMIGFFNNMRYTKQNWVRNLAVLPILLSTYLLSKWFWYKSEDTSFFDFSLASIWAKPFYWRSFLFLLGLMLLVEGFSGFLGCYKKRIPGRAWASRWFAFLAIGVACALMGVFLLFGFSEIVRLLRASDGSAWHLLVLGPSLMMLFISLVATLLLGLMGVDFPDAAREWLSRFRAWTQIYTLVWLAGFSVSIYGPKLVALAGDKIAAGFTAGWLLTTLMSVLAAKHSNTGLKKEGSPTTTRLDVLARIGPPVFIVGFITLIAFLLHLLISKPLIEFSGPTSEFFKYLNNNHWQFLRHAAFLPAPGAWALSAIFPLLLLLTFVTLVLSSRVDINEFSMHHFYKNRLVRCYLGASNPDRDPNPFTGFDEKDDFLLTDLCGSKGYTGPYPIINATINLTSGDHLAWQERKAASFTFTPRYCGFEVEDDRNSAYASFDDEEVRPFGFRSTLNYGYPDKGIHVGTAAAISGAAVSPNQGYHTSTAVAFLLTVFNVRLGWWLGNPRSDKKSKKAGPSYGLTFLIKELLGLTNDRAGFVSLSDGGHFDNLGIYELVRRRCRYIVACDAEQDATFSFNALANAVRKCRTDFGVEIDIQPQRIVKSGETANSLTHCVVGTIRYPDFKQEGLLIYTKASLVGDEPEDVLEYAVAHKEFPHQTTGDQWFDESQFESYRKLGSHIAQTTFEPALYLLKRLQLQQDAFFDQLKSKWYPPNKAINEHATKHTRTYIELMEVLRTNRHLAFLDAELFPLNGASPPGPRNNKERRQGFYFCVSLIQLLEDIYTDFGLQDRAQVESPHVAGWIKMYKRWLSNPTMKLTWKRVEGTYNSHFRAFWNELHDM